MTIGIAIRDAVGVTHWAPYSEKGARASNSARSIFREFQRVSKPRLSLACEDWKCLNSQVNQVRRVSTLISSVTCIACITRL